jgi:hypothetical protein
MTPADKSATAELRNRLKVEFAAKPELHVADGIGITEEEYVRARIDEMCVGGRLEVPRLSDAAGAPVFTDEDDEADDYLSPSAQQHIGEQYNALSGNPGQELLNLAAQLGNLHRDRDKLNHRAGACVE